jgi:hypothetical protein
VCVWGGGTCCLLQFHMEAAGVASHLVLIQATVEQYQVGGAGRRLSRRGEGAHQIPDKRGAGVCVFGGGGLDQRKGGEGAYSR